MKIKSQRDFWSGLMFLAVGARLRLGRAVSTASARSARPGPGYFPFGLGVLLALLGALVLFKSLTIETDGGEPIGAFAWKPLVIDPRGGGAVRRPAAALGMVAALPLLIVISSLAGDEFHWSEALINSVVLDGRLVGDLHPRA